MKLFKVGTQSKKCGSTISDTSQSRIIIRIIGLLGGVIIVLCLFACTQERDERSNSPDTLKTQQPTVQPPADTTAKPKTTKVQQPTKVTVKVDTTATLPTADATEQVDSMTTVQPDTTTIVRAPTIAEVLARHVDSLNDIKGVVNVDSIACDGGTCIQITVTRRTKSILSKLPTSIEGYQVVVVERKGGH
jgi:cytoskeletal protein RodZ